jgi:hypothetical protein
MRRETDNDCRDESGVLHRAAIRVDEIIRELRVSGCGKFVERKGREDVGLYIVEICVAKKLRRGVRK